MKSSLVVALFVWFLAFSLLTGCGGSGGNGSSGLGGGSSTPSISSLSPSSAARDSKGFNLTVNGSGFVSGSQVLWEQIALTTTYVGSTKLTAQVPATNLVDQGTFAIKVANPAPSGGTSAAFDFSIGNPVPALSSIAPTSALAGSAALTLALTGSDFLSSSHAEWNGTPLTTTYVNETTLTAQVPAEDLAGAATNVSVAITVVNPNPNGGASSSSTFQVQAPITYVRTINLPANDIVWDATHGKIYASLPSSDNNGNSVVAIDPVSGDIGTPQPAGNEPNELALSDDDSTLYVGLDGIGAIERFSLPTMTKDSSFNIQLPNDPTFGQQKAISLAVAPGSAHTLAVRLGSSQLFGGVDNNGGVDIFDDSTMRPNGTTYPTEHMQGIAWSANGSFLYGGPDNSPGNFTVMTVDSSGISSVTNYDGELPVVGNPYFDATSGLVYIDGGWVVDPEQGNVEGTFNLNPMNSFFNYYDYLDWSPRCVVDSQRNIVFFLGQTEAQAWSHTGVTLEAFDSTTYKQLGILTINEPTGYLGRFIHWGNSGLAFVMATARGLTGGGSIYIVDGNFVNNQQPAAMSSGTAAYTQPKVASISPQSAVAGSPTLTMTVTGNNFFPSTKVVWGGRVLQTTFISSTELQVMVGPSNLSTPGNVPITVTDSTTGIQPPASTVFTVLPPSSAILAENLAGLDVAWDSKSQQLLVPVWSADSQYPNTVVAINPTTGSVVRSVAVQPDPQTIGVTDDGEYVYLGFAVANSMTRLSLPNLDGPMSWRLPIDPEWGPLWVNSFQPEPGFAHTVAVDFGSTGKHPWYAGNVTLYDDGIARAQTGAGSYDDDLAWGANNTQLYAASPTPAQWLFDTFDVTTSGLTFTQRLGITGPAPTEGARIHFDMTTGYLYDDSGTVYDPVTNTTVGNFNASGYVVVDAALNRVFILGQAGSQYAIESFDKTTYAEVGVFVLPTLVGTPTAFIRWGTNGLAIMTYNADAAILVADPSGNGTGPAGMLYIINDTTFVNANAAPANGNLKSSSVHSFVRPAPFGVRRNQTASIFSQR
ncbi:MAG TPA: IPT/TIG domain-containing protein [Terracidiphilus sp.]|nr:IPT/TIG domain-containing protein [Terracidiphilus sp.]